MVLKKCGRDGEGRKKGRNEAEAGWIEAEESKPQIRNVECVQVFHSNNKMTRNNMGGLARQKLEGKKDDLQSSIRVNNKQLLYNRYPMHKTSTYGVPKPHQSCHRHP